jgi:hypothetical protein
MTTKRTSPSAYGDVKFVMDLALNKPGLRYECDSAGKAINFKQRCNRYRNLLRDMAQEAVLHVPGQRAETAYDILVIRQVNAEGESDRRGAVLVFEHHKPEGRIIDPETGLEIKPQIESLFDDPA